MKRLLLQHKGTNSAIPVEVGGEIVGVMTSDRTTMILDPKAAQYRDKDASTATLSTDHISKIRGTPTTETTVPKARFAKYLSNALKDNLGVIVRGHGSFARGSSVDEAMVHLHVIENSCFVNYMIELAKKK